MKRTILIALSCVALGATANEVYKKFAISDLYILRATGCEKVANGATSYLPAFSTTNTGSQAAVRSTSGSNRTLWQDVNCLTQPVYMP